MPHVRDLVELPHLREECRDRLYEFLASLQTASPTICRMSVRLSSGLTFYLSHHSCSHSSSVPGFFATINVSILQALLCR